MVARGGANCEIHSQLSYYAAVAAKAMVKKRSADDFELKKKVEEQSNRPHSTMRRCRKKL